MWLVHFVFFRVWMVGMDLLFTFLFPLCYHQVPKGFSSSSQRVPQVANVFPIAPYFYDLCFGQSWSRVVQRGGSPTPLIWGVPIVSKNWWWPNQGGSFQKKFKNFECNPQLVNRSNNRYLCSISWGWFLEHGIGFGTLGLSIREVGLGALIWFALVCSMILNLLFFPCQGMLIFFSVLRSDSTIWNTFLLYFGHWTCH
jgi:hypothetical protein